MDATGAGPRAPMPRPGGARPQDAAPFPGADRVDPAQVFRADGYTSPPASSNGLASVALWLSAFFLFLPPLLLVSGALGGIAWVRAAGRDGAGLRAGRGAVAVSVAGLLLWATVVLLIRTM